MVWLDTCWWWCKGQGLRHPVSVGDALSWTLSPTVVTRESVVSEEDSDESRVSDYPSSRLQGSRTVGPPVVVTSQT